jgi:hypothetical protein
MPTPKGWREKLCLLIGVRTLPFVSLMVNIGFVHDNFFPRALQ